MPVAAWVYFFFLYAEKFLQYISHIVLSPWCRDHHDKETSLG
jgi:hypothetical protein